MLAICIGGAVLLACALQASPLLAQTFQITHPLVAACVLLLGIGCLCAQEHRPAWRAVGQLCAGIAAALAAFGLAAPLLLAGLNPATPLWRALAQAGHGSVSIGIGLGAGLGAMAIAASQLLRQWRRDSDAQVAGGIALAVVLAGLIGHLDNLQPSGSLVAWPTLLLMLALAAAALLARPRAGFVAVLLARSSAGRLARLLLGCVTALVLLASCAVSSLIVDPGDRALIAHASAGALACCWLVVIVAAVGSDRIERRQRGIQHPLALLAGTDPVTGLHSRDHMWLLASSPPEPDRPGALLFVDLDHFRSINASFGPAFGDELLHETGRRLQALAPAFDVGRLRSDEFAILARDMHLAEAEHLGAAITRSIAQPVVVSGRTLHLTASVGIAHTDTVGDIGMLLAATEAMYAAKAAGGNQAALFQPSMRDARRLEFDLGQDLHKALDSEDQFSLVYQPVLRLSDRKLVAVEALARWNHPRLGDIPAGRFIGLAEKNGLMPRLGHKLMKLAVPQLARWRDRHPQTYPVINLNVSALQFSGGDVIADLVGLLNRHGLSPSHFCIEVTESAFADQTAASALCTARDHGFKVAMDDFGVGYSSLSQLPLLPLTSIKLDRSLIVNADDSEDGAFILAALIPLAHALRLDVVAEGVETDAQLAMVTDCHCDAVQGFLLGRPLAPAGIDLWLQ